MYLNNVRVQCVENTGISYLGMDLNVCLPTAYGDFKSKGEKLSSSGLVMYMMTSSNGNIFRVTDPLCPNSPVTGEFPSQRPVTRSFDVFVDLRLKKRLSKQSWGWWFETPSRSLWRHCNEDSNPCISETQQCPFRKAKHTKLSTTKLKNPTEQTNLWCPLHATAAIRSLLLTWIDFNHSMDK